MDTPEAPKDDEDKAAAVAEHLLSPEMFTGWGVRTLARIAAVVRERFGVDYTLPGVDLLLHRLGWSVQVPARRAAERNEEQIAAWREESWPEIKRSRRTWAPGWSSRTSPARG